MVVGYSYNLKGLDEVLNNLNLVERKVNSEVNEGLNVAGELVKITISNNTNRGVPFAYSQVTKTRLHTDGGTGHKTVKVGYKPNVAWRMWFLEKGTRHGVKAYRIVERSLDESTGEVEEIFKTTISNALRL